MVWCLRKADKEIKHRGLRKVQPSLHLAKAHLDKAQHNLALLLELPKIGFLDWTASAGFYCLYHCFLSIASKHGYESKNQTCTIALMQYLVETKSIDLDAIFINYMQHQEKTNAKEKSLIELREDMTYGVKTTLLQPKYDEIVSLCKALLDQTKRIVYD